jgi:hypothetical protein
MSTLNLPHDGAVPRDKPPVTHTVAGVGEVLLGVWLLSEFKLRIAVLTALGCFSVFLGGAACTTVAGHTDCGCFPGLSMPPWVPLAIDILAVGILAPRALAQADSNWRVRITAGIVALGVAGALARSSWANSGARLMPDGTISGHGSKVHVDPSQWTGTSFPLLTHIELDSNLREGKWVVLLIRPGCPASL